MNTVKANLDRRVAASLMLDQDITKIILSCWNVLEEEDRSLQRVEQEILRRLQRALHHVREDLSCSATQLCIDKKSSWEERMAQIREQYPNAGAKWTDSEEAALKRYFAEGASIADIAKHLQRNPGGIRSRLNKLGLLQED